MNYLRLVFVVGQPRGCRIVAEVTDLNVIRELARTVVREREQQLHQDLPFLPVEAAQSALADLEHTRRLFTIWGVPVEALGDA